MNDRKATEALMQRLIEHFWNAMAIADIGTVFAPDAVLHSGPNDHVGHAGIRAYAEPFMAAFPDLRHDIVFLLIDGGMAAMRYRGHGHMAHDYDGMKGQGQAMEYHGNAIFRLKDGLIAEVWSHSDLSLWSDRKPRV
ncbi:MAG: ester cyclase [Proteobacteria bacterium]|nr:ester cyclase [Pseudomonadota bacterium]